MYSNFSQRWMQHWFLSQVKLSNASGLQVVAVVLYHAIYRPDKAWSPLQINSISIHHCRHGRALRIHLLRLAHIHAIYIQWLPHRAHESLHILSSRTPFYFGDNSSGRQQLLHAKWGLRAYWRPSQSLAAMHDTGSFDSSSIAHVLRCRVCTLAEIIDIGFFLPSPVPS